MSNLKVHQCVLVEMHYDGASKPKLVVVYGPATEDECVTANAHMPFSNVDERMVMECRYSLIVPMRKV